MPRRHVRLSAALPLTIAPALPAYALASSLQDQYESCWIEAAVGKLDATPYKTERQAE